MIIDIFGDQLWPQIVFITATSTPTLHELDFYPKLTGLLSSVEDIGVTGALDDLLTRGGLQGDLEGHNLEARSRADLKTGKWPR